VAGRCRSQDVPLLLLLLLSPPTTRRLAGGIAAAAAGAATPPRVLVLAFVLVLVGGRLVGVGAAVGLKNNMYTTKLINAKARTVKLEKVSSLLIVAAAVARSDMMLKLWMLTVLVLDGNNCLSINNKKHACMQTRGERCR
jgi:hypothetical protein